MTKNKTVAEMLREAVKQRRRCDVDIIGNALGRAVICDSEKPCFECEAEWFSALADAIEAEQAELDKRIEVLESDRDDYIEHVTTFACWQMQIANMLDIPLAERNDSGEVQAKIIAALKERTKTEQNGVDVDALLKLADEISVLVDVPPYKAHSVPASIARMWKHDIRNAVKNAKPQLPEGIEWPRFSDGELVKFGDKLGREIDSIEFYGDFVTMRAKDGTNIQTDTYGTRYERPEPEALDADRVPIKVGDTVWYTDGLPAKEFVGDRCTVKTIERVRDGYSIKVFNEDRGHFQYDLTGKFLTHRKPDTFKSVVEEMLTDFDSHDTIELDGYFARLRVLMGGE